MSRSNIKAFGLRCLIFLLVGSLSLNPLTVHSASAANISAPFEIPAALGTIETLVHKNSSKTLLYIEDAHDSLEAQQNIAAIINHLVHQHDFKLVYEEGYEGPVPTDAFFSNFPDKQTRKKAALDYLDRLRIGGAEFAHALRSKDFKLIGIDSEEFYQKTLTHYKNAYRSHQNTVKQFQELKTKLNTLSHNLFSAELREWLKMKQWHRQGQMSTVDFVKKLYAMAEKDIEHSLLQAIAPMISSLLKVNPENPPNLSELSLDFFIQEMENLENGFLTAHTKTPGLLDIVHLHRKLDKLENLLEMKITFDELAELQPTLDQLRSQPLADFLADHTEDTVTLLKTWEKTIESALAFYETAQKRDDFVAKAIEQFKNNETYEKAILIYGGFHSSNIQTILKKSGVNYLVIRPHISEMSLRHQNYYRSLMSGNASPHRHPSPWLNRGARAPTIIFEWNRANTASNVGPFTLVNRSELREGQSPIWIRERPPSRDTIHRESIPLAPGIQVPFDVHFEPAVIRSILKLKWRSRAGARHQLWTYQSSLKPSNLGIAATNEVIAREFSRELIMSAFAWQTLIHHDVLFVISDDQSRVDIYTGDRVTHNPELSKKAQRLLDKTHKRVQEIENRMQASQQTAAQLARIPFFEPLTVSMQASGGTLRSSTVSDTDKHIAVHGAVKWSEAKALIEELQQYQLDNLKVLGHIDIELHRHSILIKTEHENPQASREVLEFIRGFRTIVVLSDTHISAKTKDDKFGAEKEQKLIRILKWAIEHRSLVVLNGDFLELWREKYGNIKRRYGTLFETLRRIRRIIYIAGNHDEDALKDVVNDIREEAIQAAQSNPVEHPIFEASLAKLMPKLDLPQDARLHLTNGIPEESIAFSGNDFYLDISTLDRLFKKKGNGIARTLNRMIRDVQQRLNEQIQKDFGNVKIRRYYLNYHRGLYFEHGHAGDPLNYESRIGKRLAIIAGLFQRWSPFQYLLIRLVALFVVTWARLFPRRLLRRTQGHIQRILTAGDALKRYVGDRGLDTQDLVVFFGHTHYAYLPGEGPFDGYSWQFNQVHYANTGTWIRDEEHYERNGGPLEQWLLMGWDGNIHSLNGSEAIEGNHFLAAEEEHIPGQSPLEGSWTRNNPASPGSSASSPKRSELRREQALSPVFVSYLMPNSKPLSPTVTVFVHSEDLASNFSFSQREEIYAITERSGKIKLIIYGNNLKIQALKPFSKLAQRSRRVHEVQGSFQDAYRLFGKPNSKRSEMHFSKGALSRSSHFNERHRRLLWFRYAQDEERRGLLTLAINYFETAKENGGPLALLGLRKTDEGYLTGLDSFLKFLESSYAAHLVVAWAA